MQKFIIKRIKEKIELNEKDYADNYIAKLSYSNPEYVNNNPDNVADPAKQIESADKNMEKIEKRIKTLKQILKGATKNEG